MKRTGVAALVALFLVAGCSGTAGSSETSERTVTATATVTTTVTTTPSPEALTSAHIGQSLHTHWGTVTPLKVDQTVPVDTTARPPGSKTWMGVLVKTCVTGKQKNGKRVGLGWDAWTVSDRQGGTYNSFAWTGTEYPQPVYPFDGRAIPIGQCVKGWIVFNKPKGVRPVSVNYAPQGEDASAWRF